MTATCDGVEQSLKQVRLALTIIPINPINLRMEPNIKGFQVTEALRPQAPKDHGAAFPTRSA
jgi:hypothetical protein